jgi:hypothetical protein
MTYVSKKVRFIEFIDKTLHKVCEDAAGEILQKKHLEKLVFKIKIKDIGFIRFVEFTGDSYNIFDNYDDKVDCSYIIDHARILHQLLIGKVLPYNSRLVGKMNSVYFNEKSKVVSSLFIPAKNYYSEIIRGTRFTLKNQA